MLPDGLAIAADGSPHTVDPGTEHAVRSRPRVHLMGGVGLAACKVSTDSDTGNESAADPRIIEPPDSDVEIPATDITHAWLDSGDLKAMFGEPLFKAYEEKHSSVSIDYQPSPWDRINEVVPLAVRNNSAPDVFALPNNVPPQVAVNEGWVQPIEDLVVVQ